MKFAGLAGYVAFFIVSGAVRASSLYGLEQDGSHFHAGVAELAELDRCLTKGAESASFSGTGARLAFEDVQAIAARRAQMCLQPLLDRMRTTAGGAAQEIDEEELLSDYAQQQAASAIERSVLGRVR